MGVAVAQIEVGKRALEFEELQKEAQTDSSPAMMKRLEEALALYQAAVENLNMEMGMLLSSVPGQR